MFYVVRHRRAGMTLVELLVVVAILGLLAVTVLPTLSNTADARRTRDAARTVSSYIAKAQSRAIGRTEWAGIWLTPPTTNPTAGFALDLCLADVPVVFCGDSAPTLVSGMQAGSSTFVLSSGSLNGDRVSGSTGDLVRFDGQSPWYAFVNSTTVRLRDGTTCGIDDYAQRTQNTPLPAAGVPHTFELLRQPIRAGSPVSLSDGRCVDLSWSGFGGSNLATYTANVFPTGANVAVLFDGTGRLRQLFFATAGGTRVNAPGAVFLLIGRSDRSGNDKATLSATDDSLGANWQYPDSFWIAIEPLSGVAKTAECKPNAADVFDSQSFIRSELVAGGR